MKVREAGIEDAEDLYVLWVELLKYEKESGGDYPVMIPESLRWLRTFIDSLIDPNSVIYVAEKDSKIVGFLKAVVEYRELTDPAVYIRIIQMFVQKKHRSSSAAKRLSVALRKWAAERDITKAELVAVNSEEQINRWVKKGWKPYMILMRKDYVGTF